MALKKLRAFINGCGGVFSILTWRRCHIYEIMCKFSDFFHEANFLLPTSFKSDFIKGEKSYRHSDFADRQYMTSLLI